MTEDYLKLNCQIMPEDYLGVEPEFCNGELLGIFITESPLNGDGGQVVVGLSPDQVRALIGHLCTVYGTFLQGRGL